MAAHPLQDRVDALQNSFDLILWIFVAQVALIVFMLVVIVWTDRRSRHKNADYFTGYHRAMHEALEEENAPVLPKRSLASSSGHPVVHEPVKVPDREPDEITTVVPVPRRGSHRAAGPAK